MPIINTTLTLKDLPPSPSDKTGWPWTEQSQPLPERMPDGSKWPRISIVTPSYNQGQFIEETIRSVLLQGYPNLEYIIIDGGSTDSSVEIIKKYESYLAYWVSEPDKGQANALNKGFRKATGQLIGWQNSDDFYAAETFTYAVKASLITEDADVLYGAVNIIDEIGNVIETISASELKLEDMFPWFKLHNESMFFKKRIFEQGNFINESFNHYIDYEFFWRLIIADYKFYFVPQMNTYHRRHENAKSSTQHYTAAKELFETYKIAYKNNFSLAVNQRILECSLGLCLDNFDKLRLDLFRKTVHELLVMYGIEIIDWKLMTKYALSFLGKKNLERLQRVQTKLSL